MDKIITIVAPCVTLLLGVAGFIVNSVFQRKSNSINVITRTRLARRDRTKELMARMLKLSDPQYLCALDADDHKNIMMEVAEAVATIRSEYSWAFKCDRDLINSAEALKTCIFAYMDSMNMETNDILAAKRNEFTIVFDVYIQTEWKRIKIETVGRLKNRKHPTWEEIHQEYMDSYLL